MPTTKDTARQVIERLPDEAGWTDIMYELYVQQKIEAGLAAVADGRTIDHEIVERQLLGDAD